MHYAKTPSTLSRTSFDMHGQRSRSQLLQLTIVHSGGKELRSRGDLLHYTLHIFKPYALQQPRHLFSRAAAACMRFVLPVKSARRQGPGWRPLCRIFCFLLQSRCRFKVWGQAFQLCTLPPSIEGPREECAPIQAYGFRRRRPDLP